MQPGRKTLCVRRYIAEEMEGRQEKEKEERKKKSMSDDLATLNPGYYI
jgi:hypothetical protein